MITFTPSDLDFMQKRGNSPEAVQKQFSFFEKGFDFANLQAAATLGHGIVKLSDSERNALIANYDKLTSTKSLLKFVPASGAASRMFKEIFSFLEKNDEETKQKATALIHKLHDYALYDDLAQAMAKDKLSLAVEIQQDNYPLIVDYLLNGKGLDYGNKPKAVLKFHRYPNECRTALEEHLVEAAGYARAADGVCRIHFTVSPHHLGLFKNLLNEVQGKYEQRFGVKYQVEFSTQSPTTDTLAATEDNQPFRDNQGNLLFRPGGHGALIQNMNQLRADVIFVKNIDNVFSDSDLQDTITYKKTLAAYLITLQNQLFDFLHKMQINTLSNAELTEIRRFAEEKLQVRFNHENVSQEELQAKLNRPIRVCGMVKNEGEPGGGPFFVKDSRGEVSLQIVESSQINQNNPQQKAIMQGATHFNPVDMVCSSRTFVGGYFDLTKYVDPETGFISSKSYEGRTLRAMELPGLWNGAMAHWITIFVEVPLTTFHPVKTMFDLDPSRKS